MEWRGRNGKRRKVRLDGGNVKKENEGGEIKAERRKGRKIKRDVNRERVRGKSKGMVGEERVRNRVQEKDKERDTVGGVGESERLKQKER